MLSVTFLFSIYVLGLFVPLLTNICKWVSLQSLIRLQKGCMNGKAKDTKNRMTSKFLHYVYVVLTYIEKREEK